jgi:hypothetical protein
MRYPVDVTMATLPLQYRRAACPRQARAHIASVRQYTVDGDPMEEVSMTFQKITMDVGGKTTSDDWFAVK